MEGLRQINQQRVKTCKRKRKNGSQRYVAKDLEDVEERDREGPEGEDRTCNIK